MSHTTDRIKERLPIADVLSSYIKLERAGKNFKARCPFHNEKTASFFISPEREGYYCFGCGAKGDIFTFVEQFEGLDFPGALKVLAERAGVPLEDMRHTDTEVYARLYTLLEMAAQFFEKQMEGRLDVHQYLAGRGIQEKTAHLFRLGFIDAPEKAGWRALHDYLIGKKFTVQEIERAGLIKKTADPSKGVGYYDAFRSRIIIPILDTSGRVIAFAGRSFGAVTNDAPKYINSPETPLFKKGTVLLGLDKAKIGIRKYDFSILVEGPMDLLAVHQAGFTNAVAVQGTALTADHITRLNRLSHNIVIALDADDAGIASALKSARIALASGMDVKIATLPAGKDPADVLQEDAEVWKRAVREAQHVVEWVLALCKQRYDDPRVFKKHVRSDVLPFLSLIENKIDRQHFISLIARSVGVDETVIAEEAVQVAFTETPIEAPSTEEQKEIVDRTTRLIRQIVACIQSQPDTQEARDAQQTVTTLLGYDPTQNEAVSERDVFTFEQALGEYGESAVHLQDMVHSLHEAVLKERYADARTQLVQAEEAHDEQKVAEFLALCKTISHELTALRTQRLTH